MSTNERPILFSPPMVQAILEGRKTQTRRVVKPQPTQPVTPCYEDVLTGRLLWGHPLPVRPRTPVLEFEDGTMHPMVQECRTWRCPYGVVGDRLWVRQGWAVAREYDHLKPTQIPAEGRGRIWYRVDGNRPEWAGRNRPSIHMPRWASRLLLEITGVRVERVAEITFRDCEAEGLVHVHRGHWALPRTDLTADEGFKLYRDLWDHLNAKRGFGWDTSPYVWVVEFRRVTVAPRPRAGEPA